MCINFSTGYIKIYNINTSNEYFIQQYTFMQIDKTLLLVQSIKNASLKSKYPAAGTNEHLLIIHPASTR